MPKNTLTTRERVGEHQIFVKKQLTLTTVDGFVHIATA